MRYFEIREPGHALYGNGYETFRAAEIDAAKTLEAGARQVELVMVENGAETCIGFFYGHRIVPDAHGAIATIRADFVFNAEGIAM